MRKLFYLFAIFSISICGFAQTKLYSVVKDTHTIATDSVNIGLSAYKGAWTIGCIYKTLDAADATVKIQVSHDRTEWFDYGTTSTLTLDGTTNNKGYGDDNHLFTYMRVLVNKGSCTSGTLKIVLFTFDE